MNLEQVKEYLTHRINQLTTCKEIADKAFLDTYKTDLTTAKEWVRIADHDGVALIELQSLLLHINKE